MPKNRKDPEAHKQYMREWRAKNPDYWKKRRVAVCEWLKTHPDYNKGQHLRIRYGIGVLGKKALLEAQKGRCKICFTDDPGTKVGWHVDHDHITGLVRGIVCHKCNVRIGWVENLAKEPKLTSAIRDYLDI